MARVPHGGTLVDNPVSVAPGFQMENVFTFAGIPSVAQGMFQSMKHRLVGGDPVLARTVRTNLPEGIIAEPLGALQSATTTSTSAPTRLPQRQAQRLAGAARHG
jgi:molybdopterin-biosynthesis enzyme MoeA-like protein